MPHKAHSGECFERDHSERRDYLAGEPMHCGTCLRLLQGREWVWVRYEMFSDTGRGYLIGPDDTIIRIDGTECVRWPYEGER